MSKVVTIIETAAGFLGSLFAVAALLIPTPLPSLNKTYVAGCVGSVGEEDRAKTTASLSQLVASNRKIVYVELFVLDFHGFPPTDLSARLSDCPDGSGKVSSGIAKSAAVIPVSQNDVRSILSGTSSDMFDRASIEKVALHLRLGAGGDDDRFLNILVNNNAIGVRGVVMPIVRQNRGVLEIELSGVDIAATELVEEYECTLQLAAKGIWRGYLGCIAL